MKDLKTGIMAMHAEYGFGNALQVYCLQSFLEQAGHTVEIINYRCAAVEQGNNHYNGREKARRKQYGQFYQEHLHLSEPVKNQAELDTLRGRYDCLITAGSGVLDGSVTRGLKPAYFLNFDPSVEKHACSISIRRETPAVYEPDFYRKYLAGFASVGACDTEIQNRLQEVCSEPVRLQRSLLLLLEQEQLRGLCKRLPFGSPNGKQPFLLLYAEQREWPVRKAAEELAAMAGLPFVHNYPGARIPGQCGNFAELSPGQFPELLHRAEYVVTNSVDAAIFALREQKKLLLVNDGASAGRIESLARAYGLEQNMVKKKEFLLDRKQAEIDYTKVTPLLQQEQQEMRSQLLQLFENRVE